MATADASKNARAPVTCSSRPFDPALLAEKLEAHKRKLEAQRRLRQQRNVMSSVMIDDVAMPVNNPNVANKSSTYKNASRPSRAGFMRHTPGKSEEVKSRPKPTRQRTLSNNVSPHVTIATNMTNANKSTITNEHEHNQSNPVVPSNAPPRRGSHDVRSTQHTSDSTAAYSGPRRGSHDSQMQQQTSNARGYRPGDAQKRRFVDSFFITPDDKLSPRASKAPGTALYAVKEIPAHRAQVSAEGENVYAGADAKRGADATTTATRPKLAPHDRHNWAQASQSGEEFRQHFSLLLNRGGRKEHSPPPPVPASIQKQKDKQRQQSAGELPANLINDAVRLIKQEEKVKRRNSLVGFFRKFEI
nr:hypothetical protein CFP56_63525 [Quercus suber]